MFKSEYFASPIYTEEKPEWVEKLDNLSNPYIKQARDDQEENNKKKFVIEGDEVQQKTTIDPKLMEEIENMTLDNEKQSKPKSSSKKKKNKKKGKK